MRPPDGDGSRHPQDTPDGGPDDEYPDGPQQWEQRACGGREDLSGAEAIDPGQRPVGRQKKQQPKTLRRVEKWVDVPNLPTERMRNQTG